MKSRQPKVRKERRAATESPQGLGLVDFLSQVGQTDADILRFDLLYWEVLRALGHWELESSTKLLIVVFISLVSRQSDTSSIRTER